MKGAYLEEAKKMVLREVPIEEPKKGELRIKLSKVGICGSDVHLFLGHRLLERPTIIGHEGLGFIEKIGEGIIDRNIGERVIIEPNIPCGTCRYCLSGRGNICENKRVIGVNESGCFAEYINVPEAFAWSIPDDISDEDAVTVEPMSVAYSALFSSKALPGDTIAVIGLGAIGLLLTHLALQLGFEVIVTEINEQKLKMACNMGAKSVAGGNAEIASVWKQAGVVAIFECAGSAFTASMATESAPRGSEIVLVGLSEKQATFQPLKIAREGITIVPSIIYKHPFDFERTIKLIRSKKIHPGMIISSYEPLVNIQAALERASQGNESKIVVEV